METIHYISSQPLDLITISDIIETNKQLALSEEAVQKIKSCREYLALFYIVAHGRGMLTLFFWTNMAATNLVVTQSGGKQPDEDRLVINNSAAQAKKGFGSSYGPPV